jgi:hypothetical protein
VVAARLQAGATAAGGYRADPLLTTLGELRRQRPDMEAAMRRLLASGREFVRPRPWLSAHADRRTFRVGSAEHRIRPEGGSTQVLLAQLAGSSALAN